MATLKYALVFILNFVFDTYILVLLLRLILQKIGANWHNPVTQFIIKLTEPVVRPLRRFFPGFKGFDLAVVALMLALEFIETLLLLWLKIAIFPGVLGSIVVMIGMLCNKVVNLYFFAVIIGVIVSWVPSLQHNPAVGIVQLITNPLLSFTRRFIPLIGGLDLSPIPVLIGLKLLTILLFNPIIAQGFRLAY